MELRGRLGSGSARLGARLRRAPAWVRNRWAPGALILCYHRVTEAAADPVGINVTPAHFGEHLEVLRAYGLPRRLGDVVHSLHSGRRPARAVVVTFDDGYLDNLQVALPLLERHDMPATFFITTGRLHSGSGFHWDDLARMLFRPGDLPPELHLPLDGREFRWCLDRVRYSGPECRRDRGWTVVHPPADDPGPRQRLFRALLDFLQPLSAAEQERALEQLHAWAGVERSTDPVDRTLTASELCALAAHEHAEIGAHTVHHPALASRPATEQLREIRESKAELERVLGRRVRSLSYPYGSYRAETEEMARRAGFSSACTIEPGPVGKRSNLFALPRLLVRDCDGDDFERMVRWLALGRPILPGTPPRSAA